VIEPGMKEESGHGTPPTKVQTVKLQSESLLKKGYKGNISDSELTQEGKRSPHVLTDAKPGWQKYKHKISNETIIQASPPSTPASSN
jgi:hypothetical protein